VGTVTFRAVYGDEADFEDEETLPPTVDRESNGATVPHASETVPKPEPSDGNDVEQPSRVTSDTAWQPSPKEDPNSPSGNEEFGSFLNDQQ
jgi:hypothetical protein